MSVLKHSRFSSPRSRPGPRAGQTPRQKRINSGGAPSASKRPAPKK